VSAWCWLRSAWVWLCRGRWDGHCWDVSTGVCVDCGAVIPKEKP